MRRLLFVLPLLAAGMASAQDAFPPASPTTSGATYGAATGAANLFTLQDSASNTGTGYVFTAGTAAGSTANPFQVLSKGSATLQVTSSGQTSVNGTLAAFAGVRLAFQSTKTANYTHTADNVLYCNAASGPLTITLTAAPAGGLITWIKKIDSSANACTIAGNGKTIDGATSQTLSTQYASVMLQYDGSQWWILSKN